MKFNQNFTRLLLCLCVAFFALKTTTTSAESKTVILAADSWYPFNGDPKSDLPGYMVEIAKEILEPQGFKIDYRIMPWARAIAEMTAGRIEGIIGATPEEVKDAVFPENSLGVACDSFFVLSDNDWRFKDVSSLANITLGGITDYDYGSQIQDYIEKNQNKLDLIQLNAGESALEHNIKKLQGKRIHALIETPEVFWSKVNELNLEKRLFKEAGSASEKEPIYIAFSAKKQNSKKLAELLSSGIIEIRKSGRLKNILDRYGIEDWQH